MKNGIPLILSSFVLLRLLTVLVHIKLPSVDFHTCLWHILWQDSWHILWHDLWIIQFFFCDTLRVHLSFRNSWFRPNSWFKKCVIWTAVKAMLSLYFACFFFFTHLSRVLRDSKPRYASPSVRRSVGQSVGSLYTVLAFLGFFSIWLLPRCPSNPLQHCSCPPARDYGSRVSGLA